MQGSTAAVPGTQEGFCPASLDLLAGSEAMLLCLDPTSSDLSLSAGILTARLHRAPPHASKLGQSWVHRQGGLHDVLPRGLPVGRGFHPWHAGKLRGRSGELVVTGSLALPQEAWCASATSCTAPTCAAHVPVGPWGPLRHSALASRSPHIKSHGACPVVPENVVPSLTSSSTCRSALWGTGAALREIGVASWGTLGI